MTNDIRLALITVAHNNFEGLKSLFLSITPILSDNIKWIVKDSGSCEKTRNFFNELNIDHIQFYSDQDFGIYDALNFAISKCSSEFYLVVGSDDTIFPLKLLIAHQELCSFSDNIDIITVPVIKDAKIYFVKPLYPKFVSVSGLISSHSVGTFIRTKLHKDLGDYDSDYKILADAKFIKNAYLQNKNIKKMLIEPIGEFNTTGISSVHHSLRHVEAFRYNVELGSSHLTQTLLFCARKFVFFIKKTLRK